MASRKAKLRRYSKNKDYWKVTGPNGFKAVIVMNKTEAKRIKDARDRVMVKRKARLQSRIMRM